MEPVKCAPLQDLLFFCLHGEGEEEEHGVIRVTGLRWQKAQSDGDGRAQIYMLPNEVHINLLPLWPSFIYSLIYLFICLFIQPAAAAFVCPAATQARTLVNGQHVIDVMERPRNHAHPAHTQSSQPQQSNVCKATCLLLRHSPAVLSHCHQGWKGRHVGFFFLLFSPKRSRQIS